MKTSVDKKKVPLVSILIPVFNSEQFLPATLKSALGQTYDNLEIIVVDDGSTDRSLEVALQFASDHENVHVFEQQNDGACPARNLAFTKSTGDYIQYLDADDLLSPNKIQDQVRTLMKCGVDTIASCIWGRFEQDLEKVKWEFQEIDKDYEDPVDWLIDSWLGKGMAQTGIWLTPRKLIERVGPWNENLKINQDGEFFSRILFNANSIQFCNEAQVFYRSGNQRSISQNNSKSREKAESLLFSYMLYHNNGEEYVDIMEFRKAVANNYLTFIYRFYSLYPDLTELAKNKFKELGFTKMWPVGGKNFIWAAKLFGFQNTLALRRLLKK